MHKFTVPFKDKLSYLHRSKVDSNHVCKCSAINFISFTSKSQFSFFYNVLLHKVADYIQDSDIVKKDKGFINDVKCIT